MRNPPEECENRLNLWDNNQLCTTKTHLFQIKNFKLIFKKSRNPTVTIQKDEKEKFSQNETATTVDKTNQQQTENTA